jgi:NAD(P)-dependent dehydrogenase (short-subunit alcohol dehydrogenase family)
MSDRKVIAVLGATGAQGGGLVRAILNDPNCGFTARVLTRDVNGAKAKDFGRLGAEVAAADVDNPESLKKAFEGAYGAYCVTFFWAHFSPEKEMAEAQAMAVAAKATSLRHVIWSTMEDTRQWVPLVREVVGNLLCSGKRVSDVISANRHKACTVREVDRGEATVGGMMRHIHILRCRRSDRQWPFQRVSVNLLVGVPHVATQ